MANKRNRPNQWNKLTKRLEVSGGSEGRKQEDNYLIDNIKLERWYGFIPSIYNQNNMKTNAFSWLGKTEHWTRERQMKHSHKMVERRRRLKINYKIKELELLLPDHNVDSSTLRNKVAILAATVDYIKKFQKKQNELCILEERQRTAEQQLKVIVTKLLFMQQSAMREAAPACGEKTEKRWNSKYILKGYIPVYEPSKDLNKIAGIH